MFGMVENKSMQYSAALHIGVVLIFVIGLPAIFPRAEPQPMVLTVEILPISSVTNVKPSQKAIQEAKQSKAPVNTKPVPKTAVEQPKPEPKVTPKDAIEVPDPDAKPEKKKEEKKPEEKPKPKTDDFAALMNKLKTQENTEKPAKDAKDDTTQEENKTKSDAPYDPTKPLSISQIDMIRGQFIKCWTLPAGAMNAETLVSVVKVTLSQDGAVTSATLDPSQAGRYSSDPFFKAAADSAIRAVHKCSPLQNLPPDNYGAWKELELTFDPSEML